MAAGAKVIQSLAMKLKAFVCDIWVNLSKTFDLNGFKRFVELAPNFKEKCALNLS